LTSAAVAGGCSAARALSVLAAELRLEACLRILEDPRRRNVRVLYPDPASMCSARAKRSWSTPTPTIGGLEAAERYAARKAVWHGRVIRALRPCGDGSTCVGDAVRWAAADLGVEAAGRSFEEIAGLVTVAVEARGGAATTRCRLRREGALPE
jgi:hypothetical protein